MSKRNAVQEGFDYWGKESGFTKKSGSWYKVGDEVISVTNLQKSNYGPSYYVNQSFWLRSLGPDELYPRHSIGHVRMRIESMLEGSDANRLKDLLDFEVQMDDGERSTQLRNLLNVRLTPFIQEASSLKGVKRLLQSPSVRGVGISGPARSLLADS
jgi:hypothetical protein